MCESRMVVVVGRECGRCRFCSLCVCVEYPLCLFRQQITAHLHGHGAGSNMVVIYNDEDEEAACIDGVIGVHVDESLCV